MKIITYIFVIILAVGCGKTGQYLTYGSKTNVGIDVNANQTENPGFEFNVGFKTRDFALVPVTTFIQKNGETTQQIRACYRKAFNVGKIPDCPVSSTSAVSSRNSHSSSSNQPSKTSRIRNSPNENNFVKTKYENDLIKTTGTLEALDIDENIEPEAITVPDVANAKNAHETDSDALSVLGTFDSEVEAEQDDNAKVGTTLGKMFSTGMASQHLAEGINISSTRKAKGEVLKERTSCIKAASAASVPASDIADLCR